MLQRGHVTCTPTISYHKVSKGSWDNDSTILDWTLFDDLYKDVWPSIVQYEAAATRDMNAFWCVTAGLPVGHDLAEYKHGNGYLLSRGLPKVLASLFTFVFTIIDPPQENARRRLFTFMLDYSY